MSSLINAVKPSESLLFNRSITFSAAALTSASSNPSGNLAAQPLNAPKVSTASKTKVNTR